ncbi:MAG: flippase [Muribaculaceae bacterium]|nr:flippase [Muribaculaceae bacterium]
MRHSLKYNFALNVANTVVGLLFPLITFPYVSRVLEPDGIGLVQYFQSIIAYISLLCTLGIPIYAIREVARHQHDTISRNKLTIEILLLHLLLSVVGYIIVAVLFLLADSISANTTLFLILSISIFLNTIGAIWFFQAIEDFTYITVRSLLVRVASAILLFTMVKSSNDVIPYAIITVAADAGNNIFNVFRLRKFIRHTHIPISELNLKRHLIPALRVFILNLITSIYINLDSVMLGAISTDSAVGYYTAATRITKAILGIVTALGVTLLPRLSGFLANGKLSEFHSTEKKALDFTILMTIPLTAGLILVAPQLIPVFSGDAYTPAILTLQIIAPTILFIGISTVVGMQILYSQGKEHLVIIATACGALVNLCLNIWLIPQLAQNGAAYGTVVAEFTVTLVMLIIGRKYIHYKFLRHKNLYLTLLFTAISLIGGYYAVSMASLSLFKHLLLQISVSVCLYLLLLIISRNEFAISLISSTRKHLRFHTRKIT